QFQDKPRVTLLLGQNLKEHDIREGRDVYLECHVDASPPATEVTWLFENREVSTNMSAGVIVSNQSLVLQKVRRSRRGRYTCVAVNREGRGTSNTFALRIKFAPVCKAGQKRLYGVSRLEPLPVRCELEADPSDVTFHWRFNSSSSGKRLDLASYSHAHTHSTAVYTPQGEDDFGFLLCWGTNEVGKQLKPCNFTVVPAGPPDPVINCSQVNGTEDSVSFECSEGAWDGGVSPVSFLAELRELDSGQRLLANGSSLGSPSFTFFGLPGGSSFRVQLYSINSKGHKTPTRFIVSTLRPAEKLTAGSQGIITIRPILGILVGTVLTLVVAAIAIILFVRYKNPKKEKDNRSRRNDEKTQTLLKKDADDFGDIEERGPDIIPATPLSKTNYTAYTGELHVNSDFSKEDLTNYYSLPSSTKEQQLESAQSSTRYVGSKEPSSSDVTYAELAFSRATNFVPTFPAPNISHPQRSGIDDDPGTDYSRIDFQRSAALRPLPSGHQIPVGSAVNECGDLLRPAGCEPQQAPGSRMESTV
ncbi:unnamed protein product, partial [Ixodes hexagonus]